MAIAERIKAAYLARIDELIAAGKRVPMTQHSRQKSSNALTGAGTYQHYQLASIPEFCKRSASPPSPQPHQPR